MDIEQVRIGTKIVLRPGSRAGKINSRKYVILFLFGNRTYKINSTNGILILTVTHVVKLVLYMHLVMGNTQACVYISYVIAWILRSVEILNFEAFQKLYSNFIFDISNTNATEEEIRKCRSYSCRC